MKENKVTKRPLADLVLKFLSIDPEPVPSRFSDGLNSADRITMGNSAGKLNISYEFSPNEAAILRTLHEATGVSLEWLVKDALDWTRGYLADLADESSGTLADLIDDADRGAPKAAGIDRQRAKQFFSAIKREWKQKRQGEKGGRQ